MALELFWGSGSPFSWSALLTLELKGIAYDSHRLEFSKKEHKSAEMLRLNPRGKVPVLRDGDFIVYESMAIMRYLERKFPQKPLFGATPEATARIEQTLSEIHSYLAKPLGDVTRPFLFGTAQENPEKIKHEAQHAHTELKTINERLA